MRIKVWFDTIKLCQIRLTIKILIKIIKKVLTSRSLRDKTGYAKCNAMYGDNAV